MSARGEHEAEGRAVEAHQEAKHAARTAADAEERPFALEEFEAADVLDALADCLELAEETGRAVLAEKVRGLLRLLKERAEEVLSG